MIWAFYDSSLDPAPIDHVVHHPDNDGPLIHAERTGLEFILAGDINYNDWYVSGGTLLKRNELPDIPEVLSKGVVHSFPGFPEGTGIEGMTDQVEGDTNLDLLFNHPGEYTFKVIPPVSHKPKEYKVRAE